MEQTAETVIDAGRERRFRALVETQREGAVRLAWRLLGGDRTAAEDVAQEAFCRAYRALGRFREESSLETWLYRIVVRQAQKQRRWRAVRDRWAGPWPVDIPDPQPDALPDPPLQRRLGAAILSLSPGQREALVLVHLEGHGVTRAAEILGKSPGTLKTQLHRALRRLRADLEDLDPAPTGPPNAGAPE